MPVNETASLEHTLTEDVGVSVDRVYMNALYPERFSKDEAERLEAVSSNGNGTLRAACRAALARPAGPPPSASSWRGSPSW